MYIPTWLIVAIIIGIFIYLRVKKNKTSRTDKMWKQAEEGIAAIFEMSEGKSYLVDKEEMINSMRKDIIRLRERYKYDNDKLEQITHDWLDFSIALLKIVRAEIFDEVKSSVGNYDIDEYHKEIQEPNITIQEVSKRVEKLLGKSSSKPIHKKLSKNKSSNK